MPGDVAPGLASQFSATRAPGGTRQECPWARRKVVWLRWANAVGRCTDTVELVGGTENFSDGETIPVTVADRGAPKEEHTTLTATVRGNGFRVPWRVLDVLPIRAEGGGGYVPRREVDGWAEATRTPLALPVGFVLRFKNVKVHDIAIPYNRTEPKVDATATTPEIPETTKTVSIYTWFDLGINNFLVTVTGNIRYIRGWGKEYVELPDPQPPGGFVLFKKNCHWGKQNKVDLSWTYWDGTAWKPTPPAYHGGNGNHFTASFYNDGTKWVCREDETLVYPEPLPDWPKAVYEGPGNRLEKVLDRWKKEIEKAWSDQFDLKRVECKSTRTECCRYRVVCEAVFTEVKSIENGVVLVTYEDVRSNSTMWSAGDEREGLASHEFGHLLGAPDEYPDVFSTQLGVSDDDGLKDGLDPNGIMGTGLKTVKKRHFKGIETGMGLSVEAAYGLKYTYVAVPKASNLALPPGAKPEDDPGPSPAISEPDPGGGVNPWAVGGAAVAGAVLGAVAGYMVSGGKNDWATGGGAAVGALVGAAVGWFV